VQATPGLSYVRPQAGTTAMLAYGRDMTSREFCTQVLADTGVMFVPGDVFGIEGQVRIGYACDTDVLQAGLARVGDWLARNP
jgi:aspartate/methionine/tyrosine aminotransferase